MSVVGPEVDIGDTPGGWMDRAQNRTIRAQDIAAREEQRQQNEILRPVVMAKAQADEATAVAGLATAHRMEVMRQKAALTAPQALDDYLAAIQIPVAADRAAALDGLAGKYGWLGNLPENKQFVDTLNDARGKAHLETLTALKLDEAQQMARDRLTSTEKMGEEKSNLARELQTSKTESAKAVQDAKTAAALELQAARTEMEAMKQENANLRAQTRADTSVETTKTRTDATVKAAEIKANAPSKAQRLLQAVTGAAPAPGAPAGAADGEGWTEIKLPSGQIIRVRKKS